jgi:hypothetical protein
MQINLSINEASLMKEAQEKLNRDARNVLMEQIDVALHRPIVYRKDDKGGYLYQMIIKSIDDKFLTEQCQKVIDGFIEANWEQYLKEALDAAMKKRAEHMANKAVFTDKTGP